MREIKLTSVGIIVGLVVLGAYFASTNKNFPTLPDTGNQAAVSQSLTDGLIGHWKFDEGSGIIARDSSFKGITLSFEGNEGQLPSWRNGKMGGGLYFDGFDDTAVGANPLQHGNNATIALWVNVLSYSEHGSLVKIGGKNGIAIGIGSGNFGNAGTELIGLFENVRWIPTGADINTGWHHIAMTTDGQGVPTFYIDGKSVGSFPGEAALGPEGNVHVGGYSIDGWQRFTKAVVDDVRIYGRPLSSDEIARLAGITLATPGPTTNYSNQAPIVREMSIAVLKNYFVTINLTATDADGSDTLTYYIVDGPRRGSLRLLERVSNNLQKYEYVPAPDYSGADFFTYRVSDGKNESNTGRIYLSVQDNVEEAVKEMPELPNSRPVVKSFSVTTPSNVPIKIPLTGADANQNDTLTLLIKKNPQKGTLSGLTRVNNTTYQYLYTPKSGSKGKDTLQFAMGDGKTVSRTAVVTINITEAAGISSVPPTETLPQPQTSSEAVAGEDNAYYPRHFFLYSKNKSMLSAEDSGLTLQAALEKYKTVRLENADYREEGLITIRSGYKLFGLPDTKVAGIRVLPGTESAEVGSLWAGTLTFPSGSMVTKNNVFKRLMYTDVVVEDGVLEDNLFFDLNFTSLRANLNQGYLKNNRFIKFRSQSVAPQISIQGNSDRKSSGNTFIAFNFITPPGEAVNIRGVDDITFVGGDVEAWDYNYSTGKPMLSINDSNRLTIFGINGGGGRSPMYFINADSARILGSYINSVTARPHITLGNSLKRSVLANHDQHPVEDVSGGSSFKVLQEFIHDQPEFMGREYLSALPTSGKEALTSLFADAPGVWTTSSLGIIPDPAGAGWNSGLDSKEDHTSYIQGLIDTQGVALLPAGTYYISAPLKISSKQGLIGAGAGKTVIIAKSPSIDMIVSTERKNGPWFDAIRLVLADLTLQGGRNGVRLSAATAGAYSQLTDSIISHVTMRNMAHAGIFFDGVYAVDNNIFDRINIVNSSTGFKQAPSPACIGGENPGISYVDKTFFYESQFVGNNFGFDLPACRANNSIGCIHCLFKDNYTAASRMIGTNSPLFLDVEFRNNGGTDELPTVSNNGNMIILNSRFVPGNSKALIGANRVDIEGTIFEEGNGESKVFSRVEKGAVYNSRFNLPLGNINMGFFVNNVFAGNEKLSNFAVFLKSGVSSILIPGNSNPGPRIVR
jgi:hypothetical protein